MNRLQSKQVWRLVAVAFIFLAGGILLRAQPEPGDGAADSPQARGAGAAQRGVYKSRITPHWFANNTQFWYRNDLRGGAKEFVFVDGEQGIRRPAFDHDQLAAALSKAAGQEFKADHLPFSEIQIVEDGKSVKFSAAGKTWQCDLNSYACAPAASAMENPQDQGQNQGLRQGTGDSQINGARPGRGGRGFGRRSPDGQWTVAVRDNNVYVRSEADGKEIQLSQDGATNNTYRLPEWSPDSKTLVAWRVEPGDIGMVYLVQSSPPGGGRAVLHERHYAQAGDKFPKYELNVFDVASHKQTKPEVDRFEHEYETPQLHWMRDGRHFAWMQEDRGHQRLRVIEAGCDDGSIRNLVDERTKTFFWTAHTENLNLPLVNWLTNSDEMIYVSEMDGWRHLYLVGEKEGKIANQITKGEWVVRGIDRIDEGARQIWFHAGGMNADQDPYFIHYYRINFDGTGLVALTEGNGNHYGSIFAGPEIPD